MPSDGHFSASCPRSPGRRGSLPIWASTQSRTNGNQVHCKYNIGFILFALERSLDYLLLEKSRGKTAWALSMVGAGFGHLPGNYEPPQLFFAKEKSDWVPVPACVLGRDQHVEKRGPAWRGWGEGILKKRSVLRSLAFPLGGVGACAGEGPTVGEARAFCVEYFTAGELGCDGAQEVCIWVAPAGELQREKHREENALREEVESGRHCLTPGPPAIEKGLAGKEAAMGPAGNRVSIRAGSAEGRRLLLLMVVFPAPGTGHSENMGMN